MSQLLLSKISAVRVKHSSVAIGTGAALAVALAVGGLAIGMLLDYWLDLPRFVRAGFLAIDISLLVTILVQIILIPIFSGPDDDQIALRVEEANPEFRTRLIASIQLSRPEAIPIGASKSLVRAMVMQAESLADSIDFTRVIPTDRLMKIAILAALVLLMGLTSFVYGRRDGVSSDLLSRAFLSSTPVPRKTRIEVPNGQIKIGRGDTAILLAKVRGTIPAAGTVDIKFESGRKQTFPLDVSPNDKAGFTRTLENVQDSFSYRMNLGDSTTEWYRADVLIPPVVTRLECQQVYPAYTKLGTVGRSLGDLSILSGSRLILKVTTNNPIRADLAKGMPFNAVHLVNTEGVAPVRLTIDPKDPRQLTAEVPMPPKTSGFSIHLRDTNDLKNKDPAVYRVDLVPDKDPTVRINYPERKEELVTRIATLEIGFDAADDFGLANLYLKYKIDEGDEQSIPLDINKPGQPLPRSLHKRYAWAISKLTPRSTTQPTLEGSNVEYWLEAEDNNNVTGPGRGMSEHYSARVVSEAEKRAEILARLGASIQDVQRGVDDQEQLRTTLGDLILERKPE